MRLSSASCRHTNSSCLLVQWAAEALVTALLLDRADEQEVQEGPLVGQGHSNDWQTRRRSRHRPWSARMLGRWRCPTCSSFGGPWGVGRGSQSDAEQVMSSRIRKGSSALRGEVGRRKEGVVGGCPYLCRLPVLNAHDGWT